MKIIRGLTPIIGFLLFNIGLVYLLYAPVPTNCQPSEDIIGKLSFRYGFKSGFYTSVGDWPKVTIKCTVSHFAAGDGCIHPDRSDIYAGKVAVVKTMSCNYKFGRILLARYIEIPGSPELDISQGQLGDMVNSSIDWINSITVPLTCIPAFIITAFQLFKYLKRKKNERNSGCFPFQ